MLKNNEIEDLQLKKYILDSLLPYQRQFYDKLCGQKPMNQMLYNYDEDSDDDDDDDEEEVRFIQSFKTGIEAATIINKYGDKQFLLNTQIKNYKKKKQKNRRTRKDFNIQKSDEIVLMPDLEKEIWPKYIGSFLSGIDHYRQFIRDSGSYMNKRKMNYFLNILERGDILYPCWKNFSFSRGINKTLHLDSMKLATLIESAEDKTILGRLNHTFSEIWPFLAHQNYITLKIFVANKFESTNNPDTYKDDNVFEVIIDVFLNKNFIYSPINVSLFDENQDEKLVLSKDNNLIDVSVISFRICKNMAIVLIFQLYFQDISNLMRNSLNQQYK